MALVLHLKATAAMIAAYLAVAVPAIIFLKDARTVILVLFLAFFALLVAGNFVTGRRH